MVMDFDYLKEHDEDVDGTSLERLVMLAHQYKELEAELALAEANAKEAKRMFNKVSMEIIPETMMGLGMESFKLDTGEEISYTQELSTSIKDVDELVKFLEERGDDAMVKVAFDIGKVPQNVINKIVELLNDKFDIMADVKVTVNANSLKAYFKRLCGLKKGTVAEMTLAEIDQDMVSTFTYYKTKVK